MLIKDLVINFVKDLVNDLISLPDPMSSMSCRETSALKQSKIGFNLLLDKHWMLIKALVINFVKDLVNDLISLPDPMEKDVELFWGYLYPLFETQVTFSQPIPSKRPISSE